MELLCRCGGTSGVRRALLEKATKAGVLSGMAAGFTVTIAWKLLGQPFGLGATVPGAIACALALVLVSLATCKKHPSVYLDPRKA